MTRWRIILVVCALAMAAGSAIRAVMLLPYPVGSGQFSKSPSGQYEVYAGNMTDKTFWGTTRHYYRFEIRDVQQNRTVGTWEMGPPTGVAAVAYYGPTVIKWAADSTSVAIPIGGGLTLSLSP